jgi:SAM-dependent methyltransferase
MKTERYSIELAKQRKQAEQIQGINTYLEFLYRILIPVIDQKKYPLEIGAGAGISIEFLGKRKIFRSDILNTKVAGINGKIDIQNTNFPDEKFDLVFGMDVLHHIQFPEKALLEIKRITNTSTQGTVAVFIEPYVSTFSYIPYRLFHTEETSLFAKYRLNAPVVGSEPSDGDQTIPRLLFCSKIGLEKVRKVFPVQVFDIRVKYLSVLAFFLTGGINRPFRISPELIKFFIFLESKIPQVILRFIACRMLIEIVKK